jgi:hypothetical protein
MFPCCSKDVVRQNKFWAKKGTKSNSTLEDLTIRNATDSSHMEVLQDTTFVGLASLEFIFKMVFQRVPDCVMIYEDSRIRPIPGVGTLVWTPCTMFCSVPFPEEELLVAAGVIEADSVASSDKRKAPSFKMAESEAAGWNVVLFDQNNRVVLRADNFFAKDVKGLDPRIPGDLAWQYFWRR